MRGNVNDSKRVSPYDLGGIAKLSGKPVSLTDSLSHSRRTPKELLERIAPLESQLADVTAKRDALMDCFFEFETIAPNGELMASVLDMHKRLESLESQLAEAQARLAGFEEGFDPKVKLPKDRQTVIAKEVRDDQPIYWDVEFLKGDDGNLWVNWAFAEPSNTADIVRWFPLPGSKGGEG